MAKTICIEIGNVIPQVPKTPIKFKKYLDTDGECRTAFFTIKDFKFIELISRGYSTHMEDVMFAYNDPSDRGNGTIFFGKWNDGVVE